MTDSTATFTGSTALHATATLAIPGARLARRTLTARFDGATRLGATAFLNGKAMSSARIATSTTLQARPHGVTAAASAAFAGSTSLRAIPLARYTATATFQGSTALLVASATDVTGGSQAGGQTQASGAPGTSTASLPVRLHLGAGPLDVEVVEADPAAQIDVPGTVFDVAAPLVLDGRPVVPALWGMNPVTATARVGPTHIHSVDPEVDSSDPPTPASSPTVRTALRAMWTVRDLPDPSKFAGGFYWLGDRTSADGTAGLPASVSTWPAHQPYSFDTAPAWHSRYPFKPSVVSPKHWLYGGGTYQHPKAVNCNSEFIEHMWLDWRHDRPAPFTWLVVAMLPTWPYNGSLQHLLDGGRNPYDVGLPGSYGGGGPYTPRRINEGLTYRTLLQADPDHVGMSTRTVPTPATSIRCAHTPRVQPKMYFGVFNGAHSLVGCFYPGKRYVRRGSTPTGPGYGHRHTIFGRQYGWLDQARASHLLVFDIRWWGAALTRADLEDQYDHISMRWHFNRYRHPADGTAGGGGSNG